MNMSATTLRETGEKFLLMKIRKVGILIEDCAFFVRDRVRGFQGLLIYRLSTIIRSNTVNIVILGNVRAVISVG